MNKIRITEKELITAIKEGINEQNSFNTKDIVSGIINYAINRVKQDTDRKKEEEKIVLTTTSDDKFYESVLSCLGAKPTKGNMSFFYAWRQSESGKAKFNPFNTTMKMPGSTNYNSVGVKNYMSIEDGIRATCKTLKLNYYRDIVEGLKNDVGLYKLSRMKGLQKWGTGDLIAKVADGYLSGSTPKPDRINRSFA